MIPSSHCPSAIPLQLIPQLLPLEASLGDKQRGGEGKEGPSRLQMNVCWLSPPFEEIEETNR